MIQFFQRQTKHMKQHYLLLFFNFKLFQFKIILIWERVVHFHHSLQGQTVYFVNCKRIPQQGRSLCSSYDISMALIVPTKLYHVKRYVC